MYKFANYSGFNFIKVLSITAIAFFLKLSLLPNNISIAQTPIILSPQEEADLAEGKVILEGEKGQYVVRVLTTGNIEKAWEVLTDYNNFQEFLPNIDDSKIIEENANLTIFEQTNSVDLFLLVKKFTVQIAATKNYPQKIDFEIVEGDLEQLQGSWEVAALPENRILVTHRVTVAPKSKGEEAIFYGIYESSLEETLTAIAAEISKRSQAEIN